MVLREEIVITELLKAFEKFLLRDLSFVLGGSAVVASFLFVSAKLDKLVLSAPMLFLAIGLTYVIGYAVQEWATIAWIVRTKAEPEPPRLAQWLYRRFERKLKDWNPANRGEYKKAKDWLFLTTTAQRYRDDHERTESLKQIGTAVGPNFFLAGLILCIGGATENWHFVRFDVAVALCLLVLGFGLTLLGWLKVTQQAEYLISNYIEAVKPGVGTPRKVWTRVECATLEASGLLEQQHVELVEGDLIRKLGKKRPHVNAVTLLMAWLVEVFGVQFVNPEAPIDVRPEDNPTNEPEPDLIVLGRELSNFLSTNPRPEDLRLVVEVADTSLDFDLTTKATLYARAGIVEYWVLDVTGRRLIVHRDPRSGRYSSVIAFGEQEGVAPLAAPHAEFQVRDAFAG